MWKQKHTPQDERKLNVPTKNGKRTMLRGGNSKTKTAMITALITKFNTVKITNANSVNLMSRGVTTKKGEDSSD